MSAAEFLAWNPADGRLWQLVDGEPEAMAPAGRTHGTIQGRLATLITNHLDRTGGRCTLVVAPGVVPRVLADQNVRVPDLAVSCSGAPAEEAALADPVLLIEILSPPNRTETWRNVWAYTSIPSVHEILVVHSDVVRADLLRRQPDLAWPRGPVAVLAGDLVLESIGLAVDLAAVYAGSWLAAGRAGITP